MVLAALLSLVFQSPEGFFDVQKVAKDVYAVIRKEPAGLAVDCNVVLIVNDNDVVMVDANIGPESANATLKALEKITANPISVIIATHYHDDHMGGVETIRRRFPKVKLFAHESAPASIEKLLKPARASMIKDGPDMAKYLQGMIGKGVGFANKPITEEERAEMMSDIRLATRYAQEMPSIPLPNPTDLVKSDLTLTRGKRTIEIKFIGEGHTPSDLIVWLPRERVVATGDLVVSPVPLVGADQSNVPAWSSTLARIRALNYKTLIPGHGGVMHNFEYLLRLENLFSTITSEVKRQKLSGKSIQELKDNLAFSDLKKEFCGDSIVRRVLFENYVRQPAIVSAYTHSTNL
jgi:glyoxylase-like metal-dependent hydrolase (beta-lactamase superfamily II)